MFVFTEKNAVSTTLKKKTFFFYLIEIKHIAFVHVFIIAQE